MKPISRVLFAFGLLAALVVPYTAIEAERKSGERRATGSDARSGASRTPSRGSGVTSGRPVRIDSGQPVSKPASPTQSIDRVRSNRGISWPPRELTSRPEGATATANPGETPSAIPVEPEAEQHTVRPGAYLYPMSDCSWDERRPWFVTPGFRGDFDAQLPWYWVHPVNDLHNHCYTFYMQ